MGETLLQFIWRYQYFRFTDLETVDGEKLTIVHPGQFNTHQGPDFLEAKIQLGETLLVGNIELHVQASDWELHRHEGNVQYANIILHVVWRQDKTIQTQYPFATLELQPYISNILLERYAFLMMQPAKFVACQDYLPVLSELSWTNWKERLGLERLKRKSMAILASLSRYKNDWASVFWEEIAAGFGIKVNAESFRQIAKTVPIAIVLRQRESLLTLEALLFGQSGLLNREFEDAYPCRLKKEYQYLRQKHRLQPSSIPVAFLRMHPRGFPTIRLAQLAMLLHVSAHLFVKIVDAEDLAYVRQLLDVTASAYWDDHFVFEKTTAQSQPKNLGNAMADVILINCIVPVVFAYGAYLQQERIQEKAIRWLAEIKPESNTILEHWKQLQIRAANALESQSLLELFHQYCNEKKCLSCNVGVQYLKLVDREW
ncbi:MAG: DUF2851 family protein [Chitinophagaceae bacterium]